MFLDVRIPGSCDGLELARRARCLFPTAKVVVTSAYDRPDPDQIAAIGTFIAKPYCAEDIARWVQAETGLQRRRALWGSMR
jgi:CheY-like chemotaxis protein